MNKFPDFIIQKTIQNIQPQYLLMDTLQRYQIKKVILNQNQFYIISIGKAGYTMAKTFYDFLLDNQIEDRCIGIFITTPYKSKGKPIQHKNIEIIESSHPQPDENSLYAGDRLIEISKNIPQDCTIFFLLSGGASALVEKPIPGIDLKTIQNITKQLLQSGASIQEINTIRKKLSLIKGGGLAEVLYPRKVYQFLLCDVIGKDAEKFVSSGPLYPDNTSHKTFIEFMNQYQIQTDRDWKNISFPIKKHSSLEANFTIGNNEIACQKLQEVFRQYDMEAEIVRSNFTGNIEQLERNIIEHIRNIVIPIITKKKNLAWIWGGESTVQIQGTGIGGRNQELCLRIAIQLYYLKKNLKLDFNPDFDFIFSSFGTDGIDGPTDAAGGIIDFLTYEKIQNYLPYFSSYSSVEDFLKNNDSYHALKKIKALVQIGPTGTNLNDLIFYYIRSKS